MNNDHSHLSGWPLFFSWLANVVLYLFDGKLNPVLQALALLLTIGFTLQRWWLLRKQSKVDRD